MKQTVWTNRLYQIASSAVAVVHVPFCLSSFFGPQLHHYQLIHRFFFLLVAAIERQLVHSLGPVEFDQPVPGHPVLVVRYHPRIRYFAASKTSKKITKVAERFFSDLFIFLVILFHYVRY